MANEKGTQKSLAKIETEYTRRHNRHLDKYQRQIAAVYKAAAQDAARIGIRFDAPTDRIFSFKDYPAANRQIKALLRRMSKDIRAIVQGGIDAEWQLANDKLDDTVALALGFNLTGEQMRRYYKTNSEALAAFRQRKASGMTLSERVWNLTEQFKTELELALDGGIRDGLSADEMSRQIRQYLNNPDKLFRRVRDEHGILQLSRRAAAFHPGQGVYRSSYKNARRLAGTETNIAYRLADHLRLQQLDFVVGIKVVLSNNHTTTNSKGEIVELHDICDELAGNYPKTFVFTGWHPNCRCHTETILLTAEERKMRRQGIYNPKRSSRYVATPPENFTSWVQDNASRIAAAQQRGTLPYFVRDNIKAVNSALKAADTGIRVAAVERTLSVRPVKQPLSQATKDRRKVIRQLAKEMLVGKGIALPQIGQTATISNAKVKEWLNHPFDDAEAKNEALLDIESLMQHATYKGFVADKHDPSARAHIFEVMINGKKAWVVVREVYGEGFKIHSIMDSDKLSKMLE
jgi:hypothetical protein